MNLKPLHKALLLLLMLLIPVTSTLAMIAPACQQDSTAPSQSMAKSSPAGCHDSQPTPPPCCEDMQNPASDCGSMPACSSPAGMAPGMNVPTPTVKKPADNRFPFSPPHYLSVIPATPERPPQSLA